MKNINARNPIFININMADKLQTANMKNKIECIGFIELGTINAHKNKLNLKNKKSNVVIVN